MGKRGESKPSGWFTDARGAERMRQALARAAADGASDADISVLCGIFTKTIGFSKLDDECTLVELATAIGRWERPDPDDPRTDEQIDRARGRKTDRIGASCQRLADAGAIEYRPGRGSRRSYFALPGIDEWPEPQPHAKRGVGKEDEDAPTPRGAVPNPTRDGSPTPRGAVPNPTPRGGTTDRSDRTDRTDARISRQKTGAATESTPSDSGSASTASVQTRLEKWAEFVKEVDYHLDDEDHARGIVGHLLDHAFTEQQIADVRHFLWRALDDQDQPALTVEQIHTEAADVLHRYTGRTLPRFPKRKP